MRAGIRDGVVANTWARPPAYDGRQKAFLGVVKISEVSTHTGLWNETLLTMQTKKMCYKRQEIKDGRRKNGKERRINKITKLMHREHDASASFEEAHKNRASMCDSESDWWLRIMHGEEKGAKDLQVSLKCHNMHPSVETQINRAGD